MAYIGMTCIVMAYLGMAYIVMAYLVMAYIGIAYLGMAYLGMTYLGMTYIVMAYVVMMNSSKDPESILYWVPGTGTIAKSCHRPLLLGVGTGAASVGTAALAVVLSPPLP